MSQLITVVLHCASMCDGEFFREDLLVLFPMEGHTTGEILFAKIAAFFEENNLDLASVNMTPSMAGRDQGLAGGWQPRLHR